MTSSADDEAALFDAAHFQAKPRDLLDELADVEAEGGAATPPPTEPSLATSLEPKTVPAWQAVMHELVPSGVLDEDHVESIDWLSVDETSSQADYVRAAALWHQSGFTPNEARDWTDAIEIHDRWRTGADLAAEWRSHGFTPEEARPWTQGEVAPVDDAAHSRAFRDAGWHPFDVWALYCFFDRDSEAWVHRSEWARLPVAHALNCARAGLTPREAASALELDSDVLEARLRDRFSERGRISPFIAMLFNHHQWQASGCEDDDGTWPFYARRLWDLHDEADNSARQDGMPPPYGGPHTEKPRWKLLEERAERKKAESERPKPVQCSNSGGRGDLEFRDGMEDWYVHCPECGVTWMGGNGDSLPVHDRPPGR